MRLSPTLQILLIGLVVVLVALAFLGGMLGVAHSRTLRRLVHAPDLDPSPAPGSARAGDGLVDRFSRLAMSCIELADQLTSEALREQLHRALAAAGVHSIAAAGLPFDPARHRAVDVEPTGDPGRHGVVAGVHRTGYESGRRLVREAEVVVFNHISGQAGSET